MSMEKARIIAFYLPQFHPIPENDLWWGKGFTEWTNVGKAKPLFPGHYQPRIPADLGYYDLRCSETREAQARLAKEYGVEGFCYWHYWFGNGKRLLNRPFDEVLESGKPDYPFCLAWANESWRGFHHGIKTKETLIDQIYPGLDDIIEHFNAVLPAFKDHRYIRVDDKPLFMIYQPHLVPDLELFINTWNSLAIESGLKGVHFVGECYSLSDKEELFNKGLDSLNVVRLFEPLSKRSRFSKIVGAIERKIFHFPRVVSYKKAIKTFVGHEEKDEKIYPTIIPNWDHSPRTGRKGYVLNNSTPELFEQHLLDIRRILDGKHNKICFLKSWNEWAEGNYLEPDLKYGTQYLEVLKKILG